ncbi:hypothetical protein LTS18_013739, partial [Coniosporium uncinatum]
MPDKRPLHDGGTQNGVKQPRSDTASPAPITNATNRKPDISAQVAAAKAKAAALIAGKFANKSGAAPPAPSPAPSASPAPPPPSSADALRAKREAMKARVAQLSAKAGATSTAQPPRTESPRPPPTFSPPPSQWEDPYTKARGGLSVGLHPSLVSDSAQDTTSRGKSAGPKFSTTIGNTSRDETPVHARGDDREANPYLSQDATAEGKGKDRKRKELIFNQKG